MENIDPKEDFAIAFVGEAFDVFQNFIGQMIGYGVTVTTQDGEVIEGVLAGGLHLDPDEHMADVIHIYPVTDGDYRDIRDYQAQGVKPRKVSVGRVEVS